MGLDQTQPPFFPILDLEMDRIMADKPLTRTARVREDGTCVFELPPELARRMQGHVIGDLSIRNEDLPARVPDPDAPDEAFLRTWAANIADDAKEPSQDA